MGVLKDRRLRRDPTRAFLAPDVEAPRADGCESAMGPNANNLDRMPERRNIGATHSDDQRAYYYNLARSICAGLLR